MIPSMPTVIIVVDVKEIDTYDDFLVPFSHEPICKVIQAHLFSFGRVPFDIIPNSTSLEVLFSNIE